MARDPSYGPTGLDLYFGGCSADQCPSNQTWAYRAGTTLPGTWSELTTGGAAPPAVTGASMVFDPNLGGFVLFGGLLQSGATSRSTWFFNVTDLNWSNWTGVSCDPGCPTARYYAGFAFTPVAGDDGAILFGGCQSSSCAVGLNDTWALRPSSTGRIVWSLASIFLAPSSRYAAAMSYDGDPKAHEILLYGGCTAQPQGACTLSDTWTYSMGDWTNITNSLRIGGESTGPPGRGFASLVWDPTDAMTLLVGGQNNSTEVFSDNWDFICGASAPACRWVANPNESYGLSEVYGAITEEAQGGDPIEFGGEGLFALSTNTTWAYESAPTMSLDRVFTPPFNTNPQQGGSVVFGQSLRLVDYGVGGPPNDSVWTAWSFVRGNALQFYQDALANFSWTPPTLGSWWLNATAVDLNDVNIVADFAVFVLRPSVIATVSPQSTDVGLPVRFSAQPGGDVAAVPLVYQWNLSGSANATTQNVTMRYPTPGDYWAVVEMKDGFNNTASSRINVSVNPNPSVFIDSYPADPVQSEAVSFLGAITGGTAPFSYRWTFGDGNSTNRSVGVERYPSPGTFAIHLAVIDGMNVTAQANGTLVVAASPPLTASVTANRTLVNAGELIGFSARGSGGVPSYNYSWVFDNGRVATGPNATTTYTADGSYAVHVWVNDSGGHSRLILVTILVGEPTPPAAIPWAVYGIVALLGTVLVVLGVWAGLRMRRRPPGGSDVPEPENQLPPDRLWENSDLPPALPPPEESIR
jgi:hypothetical protein